MVAAPLGVVVPVERPQAAQLPVEPQLVELVSVELGWVELGWVARQPGELPLVEPLPEVLPQEVLLLVVLPRLELEC